MKLSLFSLSLTLALSLSAASSVPTGDATARPPAPPSDGGLVHLNGKGKVAFVNACEAPEAPLEAAAGHIRQLLMVEIKCQKGDWTLPTAREAFKATGANAAVFVARDPSLPLSLIAMEERWGMVNAAGLSETNLKKEILRVAAVVLGGAYSKYSASSMRPVFAPSDLDKAGDIMTIDSLMAIFPHLEAFGLKQYEVMSYRDACEEGIAPPPANAAQRAIAAEFKKK